MNYNLFVDEIREIEKKVAEFYSLIANKLDISVKSNVIYFYLLLCHKLTQKQLQILTCFTKSVISANLIKLEQQEIVLKRQIIHSNEYQYEVLEDLDFSLHFSSHFKRNSFFDEIRNLLHKLESSIEPNASGKKLLSFRLQEVLISEKEGDRLKNVENLISSELRKNSNKFRDEISTLIPIQFHPSIERIENKIIQLFIDSDILINQLTSSYTKILGYFYTRRALTQKDLHKLTGYSIGKISKIVNYLLKTKEIRVIQTKSLKNLPKSNIYLLDFYQNSISRFILNYFDEIIPYKRQFQGFYSILKNCPRSYSFQNRYHQMYTFLDKFLLPEMDNVKRRREKIRASINHFKIFYNDISFA